MFHSLLFAVELPQALEAAIALAVAGAVTFLVMEGFKALAAALGDGWLAIGKSVAAVLAASAVTAVLGVVKLLLGLIPAAWEPVANIILSLIVALLGMGIHALYKKASVRRVGLGR